MDALTTIEEDTEPRSESHLWRVPASWTWVTLGEIADIVGGGTPPSGDASNFATDGVPWLTPADLSGYSGTYVERGARDLSPEGLGKCGAKMLPGGSVLFSSRAPIGYCVIAKRPVTTSQGFRSLVLGGTTDPQYVRLFLIFMRKHIEGLASGTTFREISGSKLATVPIAVAPLAEQTRIVAAVNALFEEVEAGEAALARAREGLAQFRASLLHAACTGALTAEWRNANPTNETGEELLAAVLRRRRQIWEEDSRTRGRRPSAYPHPVNAVPGDLPPLPAGWTWATVAQLSFVSGGLTKNASRGQNPLQLPYLRVANVGEDRIDLADLRMIGVSEQELPRISLRPGDLLFVEGNGSADQIGRVALWLGAVHPCVHQNHLIKARPIQRFLGRWMRDWFMSPLGKQLVQAAASSTSGLHTLSISKIEGLPVPVPPPNEMRRILRLCGEIKREHRDGCLMVDKQSDALTPLRQSILHAAFTGRLVPQDPRDEPAAALLARLRAAPAPRPRPRRAAAKAALSETPA